MQIKPTKDNILIEVHKINESALLMVDDNQSQIEKATVIDIGDEVTLVKKGDVIIFKNYEMDTIEIDRQKYNFINEDAVKATCINTTTTQ